MPCSTKQDYTFILINFTEKLKSGTRTDVKRLFIVFTQQSCPNKSLNLLLGPKNGSVDQRARYWYYKGTQLVYILTAGLKVPQEENLQSSWDYSIKLYDSDCCSTQ